MKSMILALSLFAATVPGQAQTVRLQDGTQIVKIEVNNRNDNDTAALNARVRMLEQAVRDLQYRVYNLEATDVPAQEHWFCSQTTSFTGKTYTHDTPQPTKALAKAAVVKVCEASESFESNCTEKESTFDCDNTARFLGAGRR